MCVKLKESATASGMNSKCLDAYSGVCVCVCVPAAPD